VQRVAPVICERALWQLNLLNRTL